MTQKPLSPSDIEHFVEFGFVKVPDCFDASPGSLADQWVKRAWERVALSPDDPSDWPPRIHVPGESSVLVRDFSPRAWAAIGQLCHHDRIDNDYKWSDGFVMNLGVGADEPWQPAGPKATGWHKDGDFFVHFLDSPEQALLTIVLWSDVVHQGGPTFIACDSVRPVATFLNEHREGVHPGGSDPAGRCCFDHLHAISQCSDFREATGKAGDVYFMHPFMLHAQSQNILRRPRFITNPPVRFLEPMQFSRADGSYNAVERGVLRALNVDSLDFAPTAPRERLVPDRIRHQQQLLAEAEQRRAQKQA